MKLFAIFFLTLVQVAFSFQATPKACTGYKITNAPDCKTGKAIPQIGSAKPNGESCTQGWRCGVCNYFASEDGKSTWLCVVDQKMQVFVGKEGQNISCPIALDCKKKSPLELSYPAGCTYSMKDPEGVGEISSPLTADIAKEFPFIDLVLTDLRYDSETKCAKDPSYQLYAPGVQP